MTEPNTLVPDLSKPSLSFRGAGMTHAGHVRSANEDSILTDPTGVFWVVADGMGGHGHGDTAAEIVIDHLSELPDDGDAKHQIEQILIAANRDIIDRAAEIGTDLMGATVVVLKLVQTVGHLAWVGDCRAYLCRDGNIQQMTRDHTVVEELVRDGLLEPENARGHAGSNVVTRAVGADTEIAIDHLSVPLFAGDRIVLCSDGLTACLDDATINDIVQKETDPETACRFLVAATLEAGAPDNVSVIVVLVEEI